MRNRILRVSTLASLLLLGLGTAGASRVRADVPQGPPPPPVDADHDGISEALEQRLADLYAPLIYIEPDESNYPVNVDWFLDRANLQYHEDCFFPLGDTDQDIGPKPIGRQLLGPDDLTHWAHLPDCGEDDHEYQHPPHHVITTVATDPDGQFAGGPLTTGYSDQQTFVLNDLPLADHPGSRDPRDWKTYFHAYPAADGGIMIQYWHVFAFNKFGGGFDDHGGDWDASVQIWLKPDLTLRGVWFSRHLDDHPGHFFCASEADCGASQVRIFDGTHPVVTIDGGGHAAFQSPVDWATCNCRVGESITGPIGTVVWTRDSDAFDDPSALRRAIFLCDPNNICHLDLSSPSGGVVWKTWSDGDVRASGDLTIPIIAPSAHGGLVNLGEYNPCNATTPATCFNSEQASTLLAGEFHPLNDAFWLRFEGRWGSIGSINSGPRGPVFQGFEDPGPSQPNIYRAWYNNGADVRATNDGSHPWLVPPATSSALSGAAFTNGGATFVSGGTLVTLSATQSAIADRFGTMATFYRVTRTGTFPNSFTRYSGAFAIAPAAPPGTVDGSYAVDFFSIDGLGNVEPTKTLLVTLDTTAPSAAIAQPAASAYTHSATLKLSFTVTDGGSGVANVTTTLDGSPTLADGTPLANDLSINLLTSGLALGAHAFAVASVDHVGNNGTNAVVFSIIVTPDSIKDDVSQFLAAGKIKNAGLANSLLAKLNKNNYEPFIHELQAQSGKGVDADAAAIMIGDAQFLIDRGQ